MGLQAVASSTTAPTDARSSESRITQQLKFAIFHNPPVLANIAAMLVGLVAPFHRAFYGPSAPFSFIAFRPLVLADPFLSAYQYDSQHGDRAGAAPPPTSRCSIGRDVQRSANALVCTCSHVLRCNGHGVDKLKASGCKDLNRMQGVKAKTNGELVSKIKALCSEAGVAPASQAQAR